MCDTTFAFTQRGAYFFDAPSKWAWSSLPPRLNELFAAKEIASIYSLAFGHGDSFFVSYKDKEGAKRIEGRGLPKVLREFLFEDKMATSRSFEKLRVSLGPYNESYFVTDGQTSQWSNLPKDLTEALEGYRNERGEFKDAPRLVALGAHGNYLVVTEKHAASWILNHYPELRDLVKALAADDTGLSVIKNVVLNPYRFRCYVFQAENGFTIGENLPSHAEESFEAIKTAVKSDTEAQAQKLQQELAELQRATATRRQEAEYAAQLQRIQQINEMNQLRQLNLIRQQNAINQAYAMSSIVGMFNTFLLNTNF